ncbi:MAG: hypothetical protein ABL307_01575 [Roseitalea porphyridii]
MAGNARGRTALSWRKRQARSPMRNIFYIIGVVVVIIAVLSLVGLV